MQSKKEQLYRIIFESDTRSGKAFDVCLLIAILLSILVVMLESVSHIKLRYGTEIHIIEWVLTGAFTIEYILRIWISKEKSKYIFSFFGLIDLFAILPTFLETFLTGAMAFSVLRAARLLRIFRVLKLVRFMGEARVLLNSLKASMNKITVFLSFVLISCTMIGSIMYVVEGPESGFNSIPRGIYWAVVTLTTVGYGDISPATPLGQALAMMLMVLGYGVIAVPTGLVTADIIKSGNTPYNHNKCKHCDTDITNIKANYCYACGKELEN